MSLMRHEPTEGNFYFVYSTYIIEQYCRLLKLGGLVRFLESHGAFVKSHNLYE